MLIPNNCVDFPFCRLEPSTGNLGDLSHAVFNTIADMSSHTPGGGGQGGGGGGGGYREPIRPLSRPNKVINPSDYTFFAQPPQVRASRVILTDLQDVHEPSLQ